MIKKITIRDVASYDHEGCTFKDLKKVNFIYGGNGTGKTTLSRVLAETDNRNEIKDHSLYQHCKVEWTDGERKRVLVYNKDFRERNLVESMPGVFMLGEQCMDAAKGIREIQSEMEQYSIRLSEVQEIAFKFMNDINTRKSELGEYLWKEIYLPHQDFKELLKDYAKKAAFTERMLAYVKTEQNYKNEPLEHRNPVDIETLRARYQKAYGQKEWGMVYEREMVRRDFWTYLCTQCEDMVLKVDSELKELDMLLDSKVKEVNALRASYHHLRHVASEAKDDITKVQPCIEFINQALKECGYTGFSIQKSPHGYYDLQIQRENGEYVKDTLSEGEATIITFLYFMQLAEGNDMGINTEEGKGKVVVIDDPISSLDYEAINVVSQLTNKLITKARRRQKVKGRSQSADMERQYYGWIDQIIVLTHNTTYYKRLNPGQPKKDTHYWKLTKPNGVSKLTDCGQENAIRSDYRELWMRLRDTLERKNSIDLPNQMRRIFETYFVDFGGLDRDDLYRGDYLEKEEDKLAMKSLSKWFAEGSHGVDDNLFGGYEEVICERYAELFRRMFEAHGQGAHYKMMMREE